jgi:hypothetical protein
MPLSFLSASLLLSVFALNLILVIAAALSHVPAAMATIGGAAVRSRLVAAIVAIRRLFSSLSLHKFANSAPASRTPAYKFGGCFAIILRANDTNKPLLFYL